MTKTNITSCFFIFTCLLVANTVKAQFVQSTKIVSENREGRAEFGTAAALNENFAIVGASRENVASGAAYIYSKDSQGTWSYAQKLAATDSNEGAEYGGGVKLSEDYAVVAAGRADVNGVVRAGALYVYDYQNNNFELNTKLIASDLSGDAKMGMNPTSLDVQGNTIVVGAPGENLWTGSVYVFNKVGGVWEESQKIMSPTPATNDTFGIGVAISGDYMVVGAQGIDTSRGAAYVYVKNASGVWEYDQTISASNAAIDNYFGSSVSISGDKIVVGAYGANSEKGTAYIFEKDAQGIFQEVQILNGNPSNDRVQFGWATTVSQDYISVTAPHIYGTEVAEVYFYKKESSGDWVEDQIIKGNDTAGEDFFGWSVAVYGNEMLVGAPREDHDENGNNELNDAGSAYIFKDPNLLSVTNNSAMQNAIATYPNPANNVLNIESQSKAIFNIKVYAITGALLHEVNNVNENSYSMDVSNYSNGAYFLTIRFQDGATTNQKILKAN